MAGFPDYIPCEFCVRTSWCFCSYSQLSLTLIVLNSFVTSLPISLSTFIRISWTAWLSAVFYQSAGRAPSIEKRSLLLSGQTFPLAQRHLNFFSSLWWNNLSNVSQKFKPSTVPCLAVVWLVHLMNSNTFMRNFSSLWNYLADYNVPYT